MPEIILEYPVWFVLFCLLLGGIYTAALYWKNNDFDNVAKAYRIGMACFRFLSASILSFLLLAPFFKNQFTDKIDPVIVFAHDNTLSMKLGFASTDSLAYLEQAASLHASLSEKYAMDYYTFDSDLATGDTLDFSGKETDLSATLDAINDLYFNQNVGAVIFASDGIYNQGVNPIYTDFSFPIYTIALGDTSIQKDLKISAIRNNKIAYLDDKVKVEIDVAAFQLKGENYNLTVSKNGTTLHNKSYTIKEDFNENQIEVVINANSIGMQRYRVTVSELEGEVTYDNNVKDFFIDVIDSRQKILLLANAPHPDIAAIKAVVEANKNYDLEVQYAQKYSANLEDYNLVILHQLPSKNQGIASVLGQIETTKMPTWYIGGASSNFAQLSAAQNTASVQVSANNTDDASVYHQSAFSLFSLSDETILKMKRFPPLQVPFGNYATGTNAQSLLQQKIGSVETDFPVLAFSDNFGVKSAVFIGDGLWRWRMYDFLDNQNYDAFDEVVSKTINYLALKADKRKFRVDLPKNIFNESEMLSIDAELYNESYELVNESDVSLVLKNEEGEEFPLEFNKTNQAYRLETNNLPVGDYDFVAKTTYNGKNYSAEGAFSIQSVLLESLQTRANHQLLYQLSEKSGGQLFYPDELNSLTNLILNREDIKPTLYESFKTQSIINLFWIFCLIMLLLSVEWFMRKYLGSY